MAQAHAIEFIADNPGDWMLHCHLPHHMMNQMASQVGPMTRTAALAGGTGLRGDDAHGRMTAPGQHDDNLKGMRRGSTVDVGIGGADMGSARNPNASTDPTVPSAALGAGKQATELEGPLANTDLDAGMMGLMREQDGNRPALSPLQKRNLDAFDMGESSMRAQMSESAPNSNDVPNFPQDAYMEGPMMNMEKVVDRPENLGLRPNWSRFMQGMMTFVRVLPPEQHDQVIAAMRNANRPGDPCASFYAPPIDGTRCSARG